MVLRNLQGHGFKGPIYLINPNALTVGDLKSYPSILDVPGEVDLVNISISRAAVPQVLEECGRKGVKFAIIHTAGFKEVGGAGQKLEEEILDIARAHGLRLIGPNAQGVQNSEASVSLFANFTFTPMTPGNISIVAQSGGVGETLKLHLHRAGQGLRMYASYGNEADVGLNEILDCFGDDDGTKTIMAHIETFKDPAGFLAAALRAAPRKPILALKSGRTPEGSRAAASHTGALVDQDRLTDVIFRKSGVLRFDTQEDLIDAALGFSLQPLPRGDRAAIITNTGGPAVIAVDECRTAGLRLAELGPETKDRLRRLVVQEAIVSNPVDIIATAGPGQFAGAVEAVLADPGVDSVLLIFVTAAFVDYLGIARNLAEAVRAASKPIVCQVITLDRDAEVVRVLRESGIPVYDFAETAAKVLAAMTRYGKVAGPAAAEEASTKPPDKAAELISRRKNGTKLLPQDEAFKLLGAYEIPTVETVPVGNRDDLRALSEKVGFPLALKIDSEGVLHKTDKGGVALNLKDRKELEATYDEMSKRFPDGRTRFVLQKYLAGGREVILGFKQNLGLAATMMFGLGGIFVEALNDVQFRLAPLRPEEALDMIRSIRGFSVLEGSRGAKPADVEALVQILVGLSRLSLDFPEIDEMDCNPVLVFEAGKGGVVVDARVIMK